MQPVFRSISECKVISKMCILSWNLKKREVIFHTCCGKAVLGTGALVCETAQKENQLLIQFHFYYAALQCKVYNSSSISFKVRFGTNSLNQKWFHVQKENFGCPFPLPPSLSKSLEERGKEDPPNPWGSPSTAAREIALGDIVGEKIN